MSLPNSNNPCWLRLATGQVQQFSTSKLALQLLFKRLQTTPLTPQQKAAETYAFFVKYEPILASEIAQLQQSH